MKHLYAYTTLAVTAAFAVAPAVTPPFMGFSADQLPIPQDNPPVQPAGYAFAIWGLIYIWLVISAVFGAWKRRNHAGWNRARPALIISLAIGAPWLAIAGVSAIWATISIWIMAITAIVALIYAPKTDRWLFQAPVGIYAGWLSAASFVSLGSTAAGYGIIAGSFGWAVMCIIGALALATFVYTRRPAPEYLLTVIWALVGIIVANGLIQPTISALAAGGIIALLITMLRRRPALA